MDVGASARRHARHKAGSAGSTATGRPEQVPGIAPDLRERIVEARGRVADALLGIDDITLQQIPQIKADYACKIGCFENDLLKAQLEARRSRRRLELAQAKANAGDAFEAQAIERQLDAELERWQGELREHVEGYAKAMQERTAGVPMTQGETHELMSLHRKLIKRLHPDVNPGEDPTRLRLFKTAQGAYANGDIAALRSLEVATRGMGADSASRSQDLDSAGEDDLAVELEMTQAQLALLKERLSHITSHDPYALREKLDDPDWVAGRVGALKQEAARQREAARAYDERYQQLPHEGRPA